MSRKARRGSGARAAPGFLVFFCLWRGLILPSPSAGTPENTAYVVSANDASLARVDLASGEVTSNLAAVGDFANRIEVLPELGWALVVNSASDDVTVFDVATENVTSTIPLPAGANPWAVETAAGRVFVSALLHDRVYEIDPVSGLVVDEVAVGKAPEGMCVAGGLLWVANTGFDFQTFGYDPGSVTAIDLATLAPVATIPVSLNPQECLLVPDGSVHVICTGDFASTSGSIDVLDPALAAVVSSFPVGGFPGGGAVGPDLVVLTVTTASFGAELHAYRLDDFSWVWNETNPLLPSFDFYGNPRTLESGELLLPNFSTDVLIREDLGSPGSPEGFLVGDGPIDAAPLFREDPVPLVVSGLSALEGVNGVRLGWRATIEADLVAFEIERRQGNGAWSRVATDLTPGRENTWTDRFAARQIPLAYRIGAVDGAGRIVWTAPVAIVRAGTGAGRLAFGRIRPNPSRGEVTLEYFAPRQGRAIIELYDVRGRRLGELEGGAVRPGPGSFAWNGRDDRGIPVPPGAYFVRLTVAGESVTERILRVR